MGIDKRFSQTRANHGQSDNREPELTHGSRDGLRADAPDCDALIDVVAYLLDKRRRRLAAAESEGAD